MAGRPRRGRRDRVAGATSTRGMLNASRPQPMNAIRHHGSKFRVLLCRGLKSGAGEGCAWRRIDSELSCGRVG